jgi:hypothetical protein
MRRFSQEELPVSGRGAPAMAQSLHLLRKNSETFGLSEQQKRLPEKWACC